MQKDRLDVNKNRVEQSNMTDFSALMQIWRHRYGHFAKQKGMSPLGFNKYPCKLFDPSSV